MTLGLTSLHPHAVVPPILSDEGQRIVLPAFFQRGRDSPDKTRQTLATAHRVGPTTPKLFGAKTQTCPQLAAPVPPDSSLAVRAAEMAAAIRCSLVGDFPWETVTAEPLTSNPGPRSPKPSASRKSRQARGLVLDRGGAC